MQTLKKLGEFVTSHFALLFWGLFLAMLIPVTIMLGHKRYLELPGSPSGIVSMELARTDSAAKAIALSWSTDTLNARLFSRCNCDSNVYAYRLGGTVPDRKIMRLPMAVSDVHTDFYFIFLYVLFTLAIIFRLERSIHGWLVFFVCLPVIEGLCDCIENIGMLGYLVSPGKTPNIFHEPYYSIASVIKFIILAFLLFVYLPLRLCQRGGLKILSDYISAKSFQLWRYRVIVIGITLFALPLWVSDQGQDLLININESELGVCLFLGLITIAGMLNWWLAKLFFEDAYMPPLLPWKEPGITDPAKLRIEKKASRFFGAVTFLLPAFAILQALSAFKINYLFDFFKPGVWLLLTGAVFFIVIRNDMISAAYGKLPGQFRKKYGLASLCGLMAVLIFVLPGWFRISRVSFGDNGQMSPESLTYVSLDLVLLAIAFLFFVSLRDQVIPTGWAWLRIKIGMPIYITAFFFATGFFVVNIIPLAFSSRVHWNFICLPVLFSGFMFHIIFFTGLIRASKKWAVNLTLLFIAACIIINITVKSRFHDVRFMAAKNDSVYVSNMKLQDYFVRWLMHRKDEIDTGANGNAYPIFLVNTYGGGIRAAAFTSLVIKHLNDSVSAWNKGSQPFEHFVFSYSGASGGTIGASVMCAYRFSQCNNERLNSKMDDGALMDFYNKDYLTPLVSGVTGRDLWAACSGLSVWPDRSAVQEKLWEHNVKNQWHAGFSDNFYSYWDTVNANTGFEVPLLFSNTCNVDDGLKGILSPVLLDHEQFPSTDFVSAQVPDGKRIALSTAAFLSARFPWISPTGKTKDDFHFIDGGVKENSGAETSENIYLALLKLYTDSVATKKSYPNLYAYLKKTKIYFVSIANSSHSRSGPQKKVSNLFQLTSPLIALYNSGVDGNSHKADSTLRFRYPDIYASFWPDVDCIVLKKKSCEKFSPALPLGWQISMAALQRLDSSVTEKKYYDAVADSIPGFGKVKSFLKDAAIKKK